MDPSPRRGRPRTPISTDLAALQMAVGDLVSAGKTLQPSTIETYRTLWNRFRVWCRETDGVPDEAYVLSDFGWVQTWLALEFDGKAEGTVKNAVQAVSWGRQRIGLPALSTAAEGVPGKTIKVIGRRRRTDRAGARSAAAETWAAVLAVPPPPASQAVLRRRAALALAYAAGSQMGARNTVAGVTAAHLRVDADGIFVDVGGAQATVPAGPGADAIRSLVSAGATAPLLGGDAAALLPAAYRAVEAMMRHRSFGHPAGLTVPFSEQVDVDGLNRLMLLADLPGCRWLHDQVVLSCQVFGGWRPSDLARLLVDNVRYSREPDDAGSGEVAVVTLNASKGDPKGFGHTRSLPAWSERPESCPVALLRAWIWLLNLPASAPLLPPGTPRSIYRADLAPTPLSAARNRFARPLVGRLKQLGIATDGMAGTTGRHTDGTIAAAAGLDRFAIADHLGQRSLSSTEHYIAAASQAQAAQAMAALLTDDLPEHHR